VGTGIENGVEECICQNQIFNCVTFSTSCRDPNLLNHTIYAPTVYLATLLGFLIMCNILNDYLVPFSICLET
jgi:hypothetical protein